MTYHYSLPIRRNISRALLILLLVCALLQWSAQPVSAAYSFDLVGPPGSGMFGFSVIALTNGNLVVTDPFYDKGAIADVGAVYLYHGVTHALISTLTGSTANDRVGIAGVKALTNGNFVVQSPVWNNGGATLAGAVTWGSGTTGVSGEVSAENSLVGSTANDQVGIILTTLTNGNYVVISPLWDGPGPVAEVGAVTWGDGDAGTKGPVYSTNSLVGSTAGNMVGVAGITELLINDYYVVKSPQWDNGAANVGAVTRVNSSNGQPFGEVSFANSLVGSTAGDQVGLNVVALTNGNYVVGSPFWDDGVVDVGAVTWVKGTTGLPKGEVASSNSFTGSTAGDRIGTFLTALTNGNYVVCSPAWDGAAVDEGAATWRDGDSGTTGTVSESNSLHGGTANDNVCLPVVALKNGNYVVRSPNWDGLAANTGAATWVNGITGQPKGEISSLNSLVGSTLDDQVGLTAVALTNGNYVVGNYRWDGIAVDTGAATWGDGDTGITGPVASSSSLVGSTAGDKVGVFLVALQNGNYVVGSPYWDNAAIDVGAATWGDGDSGTTGSVSSSNSLVGSTAGDNVGNLIIPMVTLGDYLVLSPFYDNGGTLNSGAVTWGTASTSGSITEENSVRGLMANGGPAMRLAYNTRYVYLAVGRPAENLVTLFWLSRILSPVIKR